MASHFFPSGEEIYKNRQTLTWEEIQTAEITPVTVGSDGTLWSMGVTATSRVTWPAPDVTFHILFFNRLPYSVTSTSICLIRSHLPSFFLNVRHISAIMSTVITCNPFWSMLPSSGGKSNRVHFERQLFIYGRWEKIGHWSFMTSWLLKDRVSLVDDDVMCRFFPLLSPAAFFWVAAWRPLFFLLSFLFLIEIRFFPYTTDRRCFWLFLFYSLLRFIIEIFCVGNIAPWLDDAIRTVLLWKLRFRVGSLKKKII